MSPFRTPYSAPHLGWCWSVAGHAGIEATREEAEAQINRHRNAEVTQ